MKIITLTTVHDPEARLKPLIQENMKNILAICNEIVVVATPSTHKKIVTLLQSYTPQITVLKNQTMINIDSYKLALRTGLEHCFGSEKLFYIDFDRLLHWVMNHPNELKQIIENDKNIEYLHIARSKRAFNTHPSTQTRTEQIANQFASDILGFSSTRDIISVSWITNQELTKKILEWPSKTNLGFYATWPVVMWLNAKSKDYIEVEGQEWETPDRYQEEIKKIGYNKWLEQFENSMEWNRRYILLKECLDELRELAMMSARRKGSGMAENSER